MDDVFADVVRSLAIRWHLQRRHLTTNHQTATYNNACWCIGRVVGLITVTESTFLNFEWNSAHVNNTKNIHLVVVIAQQLISHHQLSRLRKSATAAGLFHRSCTESCVRWHWQLNRCSTECGLHSTLWTNIWYATGDAGLIYVQESTVTRTQLGKCGADWPRQQTFISEISGGEAPRTPFGTKCDLVWFKNIHQLTSISTPTSSFFW